MSPDLDLESSLDELAAKVVLALSRVADPCSVAAGAPANLREMGLVKRAYVDTGCVRIVLRQTSPICLQMASILGRLDECLHEVGVDHFRIEIDTELDWEPDLMSASARARLRALRPIGRSEAQPP